MPGNSIGKIFKLTTFGESHGKSIGGVIDGCPSGIYISITDIQNELNKRKPGSSVYVSQRKEQDKIKILSGIFNNITTGTPIGLMIDNKDCKSSDYYENKNYFRPGHGDFTYFKKYGIRDYKGGGRASARETAIRVAAGEIAKQILNHYIKNLETFAYLKQIGNIKLNFIDKLHINNNPFFCADPNKILDIQNLVQNLIKEGNSVGAKVCIIAKNVPIGLGEPIFDRLDAVIAHYMMSINAVKGVSIGAGFNVVSKKGNENNDIITENQKFITNNNGGILAGISSGQDIIIDIAFKPTSSISIPIESLDLKGEKILIASKGRHDPCVGIRGVKVAEAMLNLVLVDQYLQNKIQKN